ncbi:MAG: HDOD domain-containing protein [Desulfuromonadales bacterium]
MTQTGFNLNPAPAFFDPADLPAAPHLLRQLLEATHQKKPDFESMASLVRQDPALCYRILDIGRSVSTAAKGSGGVAEILSALGPHGVASVAMAAIGPQAFLPERESGTTAGFAKLWEVSLRCAHAAREIALLIGYESPDDAYLAGLLHNLGRTLLLHRFPDKYGEILAGGFGVPVLGEIEKEQFGTTGPELAASLTRDWHQIPFFIDALLYQEETAEALIDAPPLGRVVNLASKLSSSHRGGDGKTAAVLFFDLAPDAVDNVEKTARARAAEAASLFNVVDNGQGVRNKEGGTALSRHLGSAAVLHGLVQEINLSRHMSPWTVMLRYLALFFGLPRALAFEYSPQSGTLNFIDASFDRPDRGRGLAVALEPGRSMLARSVLRDRPLTLEGWDGTTPPYVVDRQLQRMLSSPGLFCIPLVVNGNALGAMVAGVDPTKSRELNQQQAFVEQFARSCAHCLDSRRMEELRQTDALEDQRSSMQMQIRGRVHEASNPLGVIRNYLHLLSMKLEDRQDLQDQMAVVNDEISRVSRILDQMKDIRPEEKHGSGPVDINRLIKDLTSVWRASLLADRNISEQLMLQKDIPPVQSCADSLKQILTNLVKNAVEAMNEGGTLTIASRAPVNINGRPHVEISVADSGPGLSRDVLEKAFNPTGCHAKSGGRGLGLAIVGELVSNLNGSISCSNRDGGGAEFIVRIPREDKKAEDDKS